MSALNPKIFTAVSVAYDLIKAGMQIFSVLKGKDDLTDEELQGIIDQQNTAQKVAREKLTALLK